MKTTLLFLLVVLVICGGCGKTSSDSLVVSGAMTSSLFRGLTIPGMDLQSGAGHGTPTMLKVNIYGVWVSPNTDCSEAVFGGGSETTAVEKDMFQNPTLVTGNPAAGNYPCIIIKMKDVMNFKVDSTAIDGTNAGCSSTSTEYTFDIYRSGESDWKTKTGETITGTGSTSSPAADDVFIYATTSTAAVLAGSIRPSSNQVLSLTSALVVPGAGTMTLNAANRVSSNEAKCWLEAITFGFR